MTDTALLAHHRGRVTAAVDLALNLSGYSDTALLELGAALLELGVRPPAHYLDAEARRFPAVYSLLDEDPPQADRDRLLRTLTRGALTLYADDLEDLAERIGSLDRDPVDTYLEQYGEPTSSVAQAAADQLEQLRDEYDQLVGASFAATHQPA